MKRKTTFLTKAAALLFVMLLSLTGARAETLTVYDGTSTSQYVPAYIYYFDDFARSQFVIPATDLLNDMGKGATISALKFYTTSDNIPYTTVSTVDVYLKEVNYTTMTGLEAKADDDIVYNGTLEIVSEGSGGSMTITFSTPFTYSGEANLLVGIENTTDSGWKSIKFYGQQVTGAAWSGSNAESLSSVTGSVQNFIPKTTFTFTPGTFNFVPTPTSLSVNYTGGTEATVSWTSSESAFDIDINGTVTENVSNPTTLTGLEPATTYTVKVRAKNGTEVSSWSTPVTFSTDLTDDWCQVQLVLSDSYGDGWNNAAIKITDVLSGIEIGSYTVSSGNSSAEYFVNVPNNHEIQFSWVAGSYDSECSYTVNDANGEEIFSGTGAMSSPYTYQVECSGYVPKPTNLVASDVTTNSATLSWSGSNDSYVVQYRPWTQVGEDKLATEEFVTYTYDLSEYSGMGSIAIRHYDVTDVFYLNIDNVELKDAEGTVILSEDFESGSIPSTWTNYDVDGDGYTWGLAQTGSMNVIGNYGVYSASWISGVGALTPDNWLIIPNVALGGTFSFAARGQDPNYPAENFAVYVSADADFTEVPVTGTSYNAEGLIPGTPYAWQVKGITGTEASKWVTSLFKTKDDVLIFANDGDWSSLSNWTDVNGDPVTALPTSDNKVRIDANAVIQSGVIAYAGKTTINGGSITIKDGGELKHKAATLKVTMEKEITAGKNNFIASPFSGSTQLSYNDSWSHVLNVTTGNYDLYGFDPTAEEEWINYENDNEHAVFASGNNYGLRYCDGYFCANEADQTLQFTGVTPSSVNNSMTTVVDYDATSEAPFNGWKLIGNPYVCTGYITYSEPATFYKLNAAGTGLVAYENAVALAPGEGAFMKVAASGTITYSSEPLAVEPVSAGAFNNIALPAHGETTDQDANTTVVQFADNGDNTALIESLNGQTVDVQLTGRRLYKDGSWNTICLPFDIKDFTGTPLEGADMRALGSVNYNSSTSTMTLSFSPAGDDTKVAAGRPYIIKWTDGDDITDPVFENVTIDKTTYTDTEYTFANDVKISFKGTYDYMSFTDVNRSILFMGAENKLYYPGAGAEIGAFRAYFELEGITAGDPASVPIKFRLQFTEDDATGISNLDADADETIYNLAGQRINKAQKGVNIVNGKKILK